MKGVTDAKRTAVALWFIVLLQLCSGGDMKCSVTYNTDRTTYKITDVNPMASGCEYSWTDADNYVIANHLSHIPLVITNHDGTLVTTKCMKNIIFIRNCLSEVIEYTANCTTDCREHASYLGDKGTDSWIVVAVVLLVVLLMAGLLYFLYWKSKDKDHRMSCQICGFYTDVKSYDITEVAVEEENK